MPRHKNPISTSSTNGVRPIAPVIGKPEATLSNDARSARDVTSVQAQALSDGSRNPASHRCATRVLHRPAMHRPLRYSLAMKLAAARAAAVQPRLLALTSNVLTWREALA